MSTQEKIARVVCANASGMFCDCIGGDQGCKVGRGEVFNGTNCAAKLDQLQLSREWVIAADILAIPEAAAAFAGDSTNERP